MSKSPQLSCPLQDANNIQYTANLPSGRSTNYIQFTQVSSQNVYDNWFCVVPCGQVFKPLYKGDIESSRKHVNNTDQKVLERKHNKCQHLLKQIPQTTEKINNPVSLYKSIEG